MMKSVFQYAGLLALIAIHVQAADPSDNERLFANKVWPLLKTKCLACHGDAKEIEGELDLRTSATALRGGATGNQLLVPGDPASSPFYRAIRGDDNEYSPMPPKENDRLTGDEVRLIERWIREGGSWLDEPRRKEIASADAWNENDGLRITTSGGLSPEWDNRRYKPENLWAYQPVVRPAIPSTTTLASNPIDAFLNHAADAAKLPASPRATRQILIRRVTYDLTGLPPTRSEVEAFLADPETDEQAYRSLIDRLLANPHYGEHWGRHWLDVARYADSSGFANDYERGNAWRYRDYVVRAFNADKPYDEFIREQLAGDELSPGDPEMLIATGFLRMGAWELTGMEVAKIARQRFLDDVTDAVGQVFLAHPLQCARCHDHKFDPIPTRDYYSMQSVFATTQLAEREAPFLPDENQSGFEERKYLLERKKKFEATIAELDAKEEQAARTWCRERGLEYVPRNVGLKQGIPEEKLPPRHIGFTVEDYGRERIARKGLERLGWELERYEPIALSVYNGRTPTLRAVSAPQRMRQNRRMDGELEQTAILGGGDPFTRLAEVQPAALSVIDRWNNASTRSSNFGDAFTIEGRRSALAAWVASSHNPLTARVMVNRIWQWHFGTPLAGNPNNFGTTGKRPTHPQLLDWLAATFVEQKWSIKSMHRLILTSDAYCRSSDPELTNADNTSHRAIEGAAFAAFQPRRLTAEEIRDSLLQASGELNPTLGGIPARPELNPEVALQPRQVMGTFAAAWQPSPKPSQRHRRSLYALRLRGLRDPFLEVFNEPGPDISCEARESSLITPQVLTLLNSTASYDRAIAMANRFRRENPEDRVVIQQVFLELFSRLPETAEIDDCLQHWQQMTERHRKLKFEEPPPVRVVTRHAVEENTGETFQFDEPLESAVDFQPDLKPGDVSAEIRGLAEVCLVLINSNEFSYVY